MNRTHYALIAALLAVACSKDEEAPKNNPTGNPKNMSDLVVPSGFSYATSREVEVSVSIMDPQNTAMPGQVVEVWTAEPSAGGVLVGKAITKAGGQASMLVRIPEYLTSVWVHATTMGIVADKTVSLGNSPQVNVTLGGAFPTRSGKMSGTTSLIHAGGNVWYMGSFSSLGLPGYLENPGDVLDATFLSDVSASLPEAAPVPVNNPGYLAVSNSIDIEVDQTSEVWVTFVHEGAGYKNTLGYYVYDPLNPPTSASQIDSVYLIFPNTSFTGSGGDLNSGDKVRLGVFPGGVNIGWVLFQDAWSNSSSSVNINKQKFYSQPDFNPESTAANRQHAVHLVDQFRDRVLVGFEDINRDLGSCDQDFNDCVFYVTANPWTGINTGGFPPITTTSPDGDGDGVPDAFDDFPTDGSRAFLVNYTGTLGFEDLWPAKGDYDFNDLVMGYDIDHQLNANGLVVDIIQDWTIRAAGAGYANGFGVQFDNLSASALQSVETWNGSSWDAGTGEAGQSQATYLVFSNLFDHMNSAGGAFINTVPGNPYVNPVTLTRRITFATPQAESAVGTPPYNCFLVVNGNRGREVHLPDAQPTDLANAALFGTDDDDSNPGSNRYYKTSNNLPWALHISGQFDYPVEYAEILQAYLHFASWAQSAGASDADWYLDQPGYRDPSKVY